MDADFTSIADHAVLVTFARDISEQANAAVIALDQAIAAAPAPGVIETVPALVNLLVSFDPLQTDHEAIITYVRGHLDGLDAQSIDGAERVVQVCYDDQFAPDLGAVAKATGLSRDAVIDAHLSGDFRVLMYGFAPGYAYKSGVAAQIQVPRKPVPVRDVPAGSVIIAGQQCLVTTLTMPTGWSIIGRSPARILTGEPDRPFLFDLGDRVRFERIDAATFARLSGEAHHG